MSETNTMQQYALDYASLHNRSSDSGGQIEAPLSAVLIELQTQQEVTLPATLRHQVHAMFLHLIARTDPALSARLHNEPGYRPFTLSPLIGVPLRGDRLQLSAEQACHVRITLLDGGPVNVRLGEAPFKLTRLLSTPRPDDGGRVAKTSWKLLSKQCAGSLAHPFEKLVVFYERMCQGASTGNKSGKQGRRSCTSSNGWAKEPVQLSWV